MTIKQLTLTQKGGSMNTKIANALVHYKLLEEQKKEIEERQAKLKEIIEDYMIKNKLDEVTENGIRASFVDRNTYEFDVPEIVKRVPEAIKYCKLTNEAFEKLLIGNEAKIGTLRKLASHSKILSIRLIKEGK